MELLKLNILKPFNDFTFSQPLEKCAFEVIAGDEMLGSILMPVCDARVSAWELEDVVSNAHAWSILRKFFTPKYYAALATSEDAESLDEGFKLLHDQYGWTYFMRELWGKPEWSADDFYDNNKTEEGASTIKLDDPFFEAEISQPLSNIATSLSDFSLLFSFGASKIGVVKIPVENGFVSAQQIRTLININGGFELCRIVVREALIGRDVPEQSTLVSALSVHQKIKPQNPATLASVVLGRRNGMRGSNVNYRCVFPAANADDLIKLAEVSREAIVQIPADKSVDRVVYSPDLISGSDGYNEPALNISSVADREPDLFDRQHFESLFSGKADPWKYTHPYEQTKYQQTLSLLPKINFSNALEIACAEGHFTEQLAPHVTRLTAADISEVALQRAEARCRAFNNIEFVHLDLFNDKIRQQYDLIVCSEVLYFVKDRNKLREVCDRILSSLNDEGYFLTAHAHLIIDAPDQPGYDWKLPFGAKTITETLLTIPGCTLRKEIVTPLYRVQLFQKENADEYHPTNSVESIMIDQPTEVPDRVKDTVRWNGGEPSSMARTGLHTLQLPILMYHRIATDVSGEMGAYSVSPKMFERQIKYLRDSGYRCISWHEWARARNLRQPMAGRGVMITFDDGYEDFYTEAWPILRKYGFTATVFIVSELVGRTSEWDAATGNAVPLMSWPQLLELQKYGISFGSHTATHPRLTKVSPDRVVNEAARSRCLLEEKLGKKIDVFAYPYGDVDGSVAHLVGGCGYNISVTTQARKASFGDDIMNVPRLEISGDDLFEDFVNKVGG